MTEGSAMASAMTFDEIRRLLPQAYPFVLVDRVESVVRGSKLVAIKNISGNEWVFPGHFPSRAVYPGVLVIEGMAQAAILLLATFTKQVSGTFLLATVRAQFQSPVVPGDQLRIECEALKVLDDCGVVEATAHVQDRLAAKATMTFAVRPM